VATDGTPIWGPGLRGQFLLGADQNGRDVMVRLMYGGGGTSIYIGLAGRRRSPRLLSVIVGLLAGLLPRLDRPPCCPG